ncbi:MAG: YfcE family phosphodiesterase [Patescibacteria group bacterium]
MKIGIFSDSHENLENLQQAIDWLNENNIKIIIHCGDVSRVNMLEELNSRFKGTTHLVWGNADEGFFDEIDYTDFKKIVFYDQLGKLEIEGKKIAWTHLPKTARELAKSGKYDLVFYGDNHKPWEERVGLTRLINPGNLANIRCAPSFAVYDFNGRLELKVLEMMKKI